MWKVILERLYSKGDISNTVLSNCVNDGLITEIEKQEIMESV